MKIKPEIIIIALFVLFIACIIGLTSQTVIFRKLSMFGLLIILSITIIYAINKLLKNKSEAITNFKSQHIVIQFLDVLSILLLILNIITLKYFDITGMVIGLTMFATLCEWFIKKED